MKGIIFRTAAGVGSFPLARHLQTTAADLWQAHDLPSALGVHARGDQRDLSHLDPDRFAEAQNDPGLISVWTQRRTRWPTMARRRSSISIKGASSPAKSSRGF